MVVPVIEKLLEIRIKRISRFDINRQKKEIRTIETDIKKVEKNLKDMIGFTINYLESLLDKYGKLYPRKSRIKHFDQVDARYRVRQVLADAGHLPPCFAVDLVYALVIPLHRKVHQRHRKPQKHGQLDRIREHPAQHAAEHEDVHQELLKAAHRESLQAGRVVGHPGDQPAGALFVVVVHAQALEVRIDLASHVVVPDLAGWRREQAMLAICCGSVN